MTLERAGGSDWTRLFTIAAGYWFMVTGVVVWFVVVPVVVVLLIGGVLRW